MVNIKKLIKYFPYPIIRGNAMALLLFMILWLFLGATSPPPSLGDDSAENFKVLIEGESLIKEGDRLIIDRFSMETKEQMKGYLLPKGWNLLKTRVKKLTKYSPVQDGDNVFLKAESEGSAGIIYKVSKFDPREYPYLSWRWKAENILEKGNAHKKDGNDFPVALAVVFDYDPSRASLIRRIMYSFVRLLYGVYPPDYVIAYVWGNSEHVQKGDLIISPFYDRMWMFVLENGRENLNKWITEKRNILEDFKEAFGTYPEQMAGGIIIHTDSDNTSIKYKTTYKSVGYYDDIMVSKSPVIQ